MADPLKDLSVNRTQPTLRDATTASALPSACRGVTSSVSLHLVDDEKAVAGSVPLCSSYEGLLKARGLGLGPNVCSRIQELPAFDASGLPRLPSPGRRSYAIQDSVLDQHLHRLRIASGPGTQSGRPLPERVIRIIARAWRIRPATRSGWSSSHSRRPHRPVRAPPGRSRSGASREEDPR